MRRTIIDRAVLRARIKIVKDRAKKATRFTFEVWCTVSRTVKFGVICSIVILGLIILDTLDMLSSCRK
jgi:hypothetical protein